jgi:cholesterol transport system auxiliary component
MGGAAPATFDLTAPARIPPGGRASRGQLIVGEPTALSVLDNEKIVVRPAQGEVTYLGGAQWSDRLPRLLQARIVQSFENANRLRAVGRPGDRLAADFQLVLDLRAFQWSAATGSAEVEVSAKVIRDGSGRIAAARVFRASVPVPSTDPASVALALDEAFHRVVADLVAWTTRYV